MSPASFLLIFCMALQGFRDKNRDLMRQDIISVLQNSRTPFIRELICEWPTTHLPQHPSRVVAYLALVWLLYCNCNPTWFGRKWSPPVKTHLFLFAIAVTIATVCRGLQNEQCFLFLGGGRACQLKIAIQAHCIYSWSLVYAITNGTQSTTSPDYCLWKLGLGTLPSKSNPSLRLSVIIGGSALW